MVPFAGATSGVAGVDFGALDEALFFAGGDATVGMSALDGGEDR